MSVSVSAENRTLEVTYLRLVEISKIWNLGEHCEKYFKKSMPNSARKLLGIQGTEDDEYWIKSRKKESEYRYLIWNLELYVRYSKEFGEENFSGGLGAKYFAKMRLTNLSFKIQN
jgi:hypothetical protein